MARAVDAGAEGYQVSDSVMEALSPVRTPAGLVALAERPIATLADAFSPDPALVVCLIDVQDPGNVGAVVRAADAGGATGVVVAGSSADPFSWKALRGSMGSAFRMAIAAAEISDAVEAARSRGVQVVATVPRDGVPPQGLLHHLSKYCLNAVINYLLHYLNQYLLTALLFHVF